MILPQGIFILLTIAANAFALEDEAAANNYSRPQAKTVLHELNLTNAFDAALPSIRHYITKNGMDPMDAPDLEIPLSHLPGFLKTKMHLRNGHVQQLSTIIRTGDIILQYSAKKLSLYLNIGWETLDLSHEYTLRYMLYSRKGDCYGRFQDVAARMLIDFDLESKQIELTFFKFVGVGDFKLKLEGHLTDGLINILGSVVTKIFRTEVLRNIEAIAYKEMDDQIQKINDMLLPGPTNAKVRTKEDSNIAP